MLEGKWQYCVGAAEWKVIINAKHEYISIAAQQQIYRKKRSPAKKDPKLDHQLQTGWTEPLAVKTEEVRTRGDYYRYRGVRIERRSEVRSGYESTLEESARVVSGLASIVAYKVFGLYNKAASSLEV